MPGPTLTSPAGSKSDSVTKPRKLAGSPLSRPFSKPPVTTTTTSSTATTVSDGRKKVIKAPASRTGSALSMRSVFGGARPTTLSKDKECASDYPSSGTEVATKRPKPPSRFGFGMPKASTPATTTAKSSLPPRSSTTPSPPNTTPKGKSKYSSSPLSRVVLAPSVNATNSPVKRTPASMKSIASVFINNSPGPLSDPAINRAADSTARILDLEGNTSQDMTGPGDVSFGSAVGDATNHGEEDEEEEEGNVSALLSVDFGAPTPAHPRILVGKTKTADPLNDYDDDDDDDIDDDNDDDPTVQLQLQTPSRPQQKSKARHPAQVNALPTRQNLSYLSPAPPTPNSFSFFHSRRPRPSNISARSRRTSSVSTNADPTRSRRSSQTRAPTRDRGSILSWEAVVERSKEFSESDIDEMGMISGIGLGGLGSMSPGFGTPMYQRLSFGTSATTDREQSHSRRQSARLQRDNGRPFGLGDVVLAVQSSSDAGSETGSTILRPPETPSPAGPSLHVPTRLPVPSPTLSPASTVGAAALSGRGRLKRESTIDSLRKQLEAQAFQMRAIQQELATALKNAASKDTHIAVMKASEQLLRAEKVSFAAKQSEWVEKEGEWKARYAEAAQSALNERERNAVRVRAAAESEIKWQWASMGAEADAGLERIKGDREVLEVLLTELDLYTEAGWLF